MGSTADKIKGMANEASGNVKQVVGKTIKNKEMVADGIVQERKGEAQQAIGKGKEKVKKIFDND
jgi:uncharacterized protein YjbJ (UPF0337 family)